MVLNSLLSRFSRIELLEFLDENIKNYYSIREISFEQIFNYIKDNFATILKVDKFRYKLLQKMTREELKELKDCGIIFSKSDNKTINILLNYFGFDNIEYKTIAKEYIVKQVTSQKFYELLDYQFVIKNKIIDFIEYKEKNNSFLNRMIIHMPTGTGKTKTSMHILAQYYNDRKCKGNILWLAHSTELLNQAMKTFANVWSVLGNEPVACFVQDLPNVKEERTIYFLNYQKLISLNKNRPDIIEGFIHNTSMIICDEAHKCLAKESRKVIEKIMTKHDLDPKKCLLGLTATPGRKFNDYLDDGENNELALMFDKNITSIKPSTLSILGYDDIITSEMFGNIFSNDSAVIKYFQERKILSKIKREELLYNPVTTQKIENDFFSKKGLKKDFALNCIARLGTIKERNIAILNKLMELNENNIPTIFFACSNDHGKLISNLLSLHGVKNFAVFGETPEALRSSKIKEFEKGEYNILINYEILATGFDSPNIKCVFISRPTNSIVLYSQMLGRGLRGPKMGGNEECLLIDVKDNLKKYNDENFAFSYFNEYWR